MEFLQLTPAMPLTVLPDIAGVSHRSWQGDEGL